MSRPRSFDSQAVVDAATQSFWIGGVGSTGVDDPLQATGLSRSSLFNSFGNPEGLMQVARTLESAIRNAAPQRLAQGLLGS